MEPVTKTGRPCGGEPGKCGCDPEKHQPKQWHHPRVVPVWAFDGSFQGWYPKRYRWGQMVGAAMGVFVEKEFSFIWHFPEDGSADQDALRFLSGFLHDPYVFAALVGLNIE